MRVLGRKAVPFSSATVGLFASGAGPERTQFRNLARAASARIMFGGDPDEGRGDQFPRAHYNSFIARPTCVKRCLNHLPQPSHHRPRRLLIDQLRIVNLAGGFTSARPEIIGACCHLYAAASPEVAAAGASCDAVLAFAVSLAAPTCSSVRRRSASATSRENASRSGRKSCFIIRSIRPRKIADLVPHTQLLRFNGFFRTGQIVCEFDRTDRMFNDTTVTVL